jgi:hypothetical protein
MLKDRGLSTKGLRADLIERLKAAIESSGGGQQVGAVQKSVRPELKVLLARKHIEEEILQPKCPRQSCRRGFFDFEGCFAISCSSCKCKFCGWRLRDRGDSDAHTHVRQYTKVPMGVDALFPHMSTVRAAFEKKHKERCLERINSYIDKEVDPDIHERVRQRVLKIDPDLRNRPNSGGVGGRRRRRRRWWWQRSVSRCVRSS